MWKLNSTIRQLIQPEGSANALGQEVRTSVQHTDHGLVRMEIKEARDGNWRYSKTIF